MTCQYISQTLFERSGYANKYLYMFDSILIDIIQMPRELFVPFDLGVFVVPHMLTKVSEWRKQIMLLLLNVSVVFVIIIPCTPMQWTTLVGRLQYKNGRHLFLLWFTTILSQSVSEFICLAKVDFGRLYTLPFLVGAEGPCLVYLDRLQTLSQMDQKVIQCLCLCNFKSLNIIFICLYPIWDARCFPQ